MQALISFLLNILIGTRAQRRNGKKAQRRKGVMVQFCKDIMAILLFSSQRHYSFLGFIAVVPLCH
jgi:hypothetical protein